LAPLPEKSKPSSGQNRDADAEQRIQRFNWSRRCEGGKDELIGICRGILADGVLVVEEAKFILEWLNRNAPVRCSFEGKQLYGALSIALKDGKLGAEDESALIDLLLKFVGGMPKRTTDLSYSTTLPLDNPPPAVVIRGNSFCFTGKFTCGSRHFCESRIVADGGAIHKNPTHDTHFLVIGLLGSGAWIHSNSGRKIERAIELRSDGYPIKIISESHWTKCINCPS